MHSKSGGADTVLDFSYRKVVLNYVAPQLNSPVFIMQFFD